ncbi:MAG: dephospho-CoA kinase [candidate division Zixibacteria bacterium RBG_16_43_9]|nr:MAG: dephospho-CoA kinase [candidate division Zixibacteria bacterium RBG_16_43_9]
MKIIGITGGIGSGKTEVAKVFKKMGAKILSGDEIGKEVVEENKSVLKKLIETFGEEILNRNKKLNRRKLGKIAFSSIENRDKLNTIVHPYLLSNLKKQIREHRKKGPGVVIVDAALIIEWGLQKELDYLILVESSFQNRIKRLKEYSGYSQKEAINRIMAQIKDRTRRKYADYVIRNDKDLKELKKKVLFLWERLISKIT